MPLGKISVYFNLLEACCNVSKFLRVTDPENFSFSRAVQLVQLPTSAFLNRFFLYFTRRVY